MPIPTAKDFQTAFLKAYAACRGCIHSDEEWKTIWTSQWNEFMMYKTSTSRPRQLLRSVLHETAENMKLEYFEREVLKIDGVFYSQDAVYKKDDFVFPFLVAVEHENIWQGFEREIVKLLSVRAPLKVGVTYLLWGNSPMPPAKRNEHLEEIRALIVRNFDAISRVISEAALAQYLFLVGSEEQERTLAWHSLSFSASEGPEGKRFEMI